MRARHARVAQVGTVTNRIAGKANERTTERDSLESVRTPWPARRDRLSHLLPAYSRSREGGEGNAGVACELLSHKQGRCFRRYEWPGDASRISVRRSLKMGPLTALEFIY